LLMAKWKSNEIREMPKAAALAVMAVFMAAFGAVAIIFGFLPIADAVSTVWRANSLVEVPASIKEVQLERGTRAGQRHQKSLSARYSYEWKGVTYDSTRVSVQHWAGWRDGSSWHQEWFDKLDHARKTGATVSAWINAEGPPKAVLDKELRWGRLWWAIPWSILFGGVSVFFGYQFVRRLFGIRNVYGVRQTFHLVRHFFKKKRR